MNASNPLVLVLLALCCLPLFAAAVFAADTPILQANVMYELVSDRARLIQVSLVIVVIGCAAIWWYR